MNEYVVKVNKFLLFIMAFGLIATIAFTVTGVFTNYIPITTMLLGTALSIILMYYKKHLYIMITELISILITMSAILIDLPVVGMGYGIFGIIISSLYFNKWIPIISCSYLFLPLRPCWALIILYRLDL